MHHQIIIFHDCKFYQSSCICLGIRNVYAFQLLQHKIIFTNIFELKVCSRTISTIILSNAKFLPPSPWNKPNLSELTLAAVATQKMEENDSLYSYLHFIYQFDNHATNFYQNMQPQL